MKARLLGPLVVAGLWLVGCTDEPLARSLKIITGHEKDTFSAAPAVTKVRIEARTAEGNTFAAETTPGGSFDLGDVPADVPLVVEVTGTSADGVVVVKGRSLSGVVLGSLLTEELPVFVQRAGTWARPPGELVRAHVDAPVGVVAEQFVATTGGSEAIGADGKGDVMLGDFYDLLSWNVSVTKKPLSIAARSMIGRLDGMLLVGDEGASFVDLAADAEYVVGKPEGLATFADVAGGRVIESPSGTSYLVGATRALGATKAVLSFGSDGAVGVLQLNHARQGAAAAWAPNVGLVVAGGSADGPGVEVLPEGQSAFVAIDMPSDATEGAAAVVASDGKMALVGGLGPGGMPAPMRTWNPSCTSGCSTQPITGLDLPLALTSVEAFSLGSSRVIVVGRETGTTGLVRVFELDLAGSSLKEHPLREPRSGASVVAAPNGTLMMLGGTLETGEPATRVETFFP